MGIFRDQGFEGIRHHVVDAIVERPCAAEIARGFVAGNPGIIEIQERGNERPETIIEALASEIEPLAQPRCQIPLREIVFTAHAPR